MAETHYKEHIAEEPKAPPISLLEISGARNLITSLDAFGPGYFKTNVTEMQKPYSHPQTGEVIQLREPTTAESILTASYDFANRAKPQIFDPKWLQAGRVVRTSEGVFVNPPKNKEGNPIIDEQVLKDYLTHTKKVNGIWLVANGEVEGARDLVFVPYESFTRGVQDSETFSKGGLARGLEYVAETEAPNLRKISDKKNYPNGVNVWGFGSVKKPVLKVASLYSGRLIGDSRLDVVGLNWLGNFSGFAFGVLESGEAKI